MAYSALSFVGILLLVGLIVDSLGRRRGTVSNGEHQKTITRLREILDDTGERVEEKVRDSLDEYKDLVSRLKAGLTKIREDCYCREGCCCGADRLASKLLYEIKQVEEPGNVGSRRKRMKELYGREE